MEESITTPAIYISYAWNSESESIVESIEKEFQKKNVHIVRDKNNLKYKGSIKEFMEQIGRGKYVILIISNKYLKSENCMFELLQIFKNQDFYERIFPLVLDEVKISKAVDRLDFIKYWENEVQHLDEKVRNLSTLSNIQGVAEDLNLYTEIRNNVARLTNILKDINSLNTDQHISSDFEQLCSLIQSKIEIDLIKNVDNGNPKNNKISILKKAAIAVVGFLAIFILVRERTNKSFGDSEKKISDSILILHDTLKKNNSKKIEEQKSIDTFKKIEMPAKVTIRKKNPPNKTVKIESEAIIYNVILAIPSNMEKADVYVDNRKVDVIDRSGIYLTIRLRKKNSSYHFEIKSGSKTCSTDKLIDKDSIKVSLCN